MKARWLLVLLVSAPALAADEAAPTALVFDSSTDRVPIHTVAPLYPHKARRDRVEGEVQVCFEVTRDGRTRRIAVRSSTHRAFEKPSIKAVRASTFKPLADDEPLPPVKFCRRFVFALEPAKTDD